MLPSHLVLHCIAITLSAWCLSLSNSTRTHMHTRTHHTHTHPHTHVTHTHTHITATPFRLASLELVESNTYSLRKKFVTHLVKCHLKWWPPISLFVHYRATKTRNYSRVWLPRQADAKGEDYPKQSSPSSELCWPRYSSRVWRITTSLATSCRDQFRDRTN